LSAVAYAITWQSIGLRARMIRRQRRPDPPPAAHCRSWCIESHISWSLLATMIDTWWPEINAFVATKTTNARTEGYNRLVKTVKRAGCGFRSRQLRTPDTIALHPHPACGNPDFMLIPALKIEEPSH
jgi:Transposase